MAIIWMYNISLSVVAMFTRVEDVTESNLMATDFKAQMSSPICIMQSSGGEQVAIIHCIDLLDSLLVEN